MNRTQRLCLTGLCVFLIAATSACSVRKQSSGADSRYFAVPTSAKTAVTPVGALAAGELQRIN